VRTAGTLPALARAAAHPRAAAVAETNMTTLLLIAAIVVGLLGYAVLYHLGGATAVIALAAVAAIGTIALANLIANGRAGGRDDA